MSNDFTRYVILLSHKDPAKKSEALIRAHVQFLKELEKHEKLILCGPFSDYDGGMIILKVKKYEEAKAIAESDPFVKSGYEAYELRTWELSCKENNHMGIDDSH